MKGFNSLCYVKSVLQELQIPLSYMKDKGIWLTKNSRSLSLKNIITTWYIFFPLVKQTWEKEPSPKNPTPHQHSFKDILESWISAFGFFGGGSWGVLIVCLFVLLGRFIRWNGGWKRKIKERKRKKKRDKNLFPHQKNWIHYGMWLSSHDIGLSWEQVNLSTSFLTISLLWMTLPQMVIFLFVIIFS